MSWTRAAALCAAVAAAACLCGACGRAREEERRRVASEAGGTAGARDVPWELVYEHEVDGNVDLYLVPAVGGPPRRLTTHPREDVHARWMRKCVRSGNTSIAREPMQSLIESPRESSGEQKR